MFNGEIFGMTRDAYERMQARQRSGIPYQSTNTARVGEVDSRGFKTTYAKGGLTIRFRESRPVDPEIEQRIERLNSIDIDRLRKGCGVKKRQPNPEITARMAALGIIGEYSLDEQIRDLIAAQPAADHSSLRKLYDLWTLGNSMFHKSKLKVPIIVIDDIPGAHATCSREHKPTRMRFDRDSVRKLSAQQLRMVVLHEQLHQCCCELNADPTRHEGHHAEFASVCNQVAEHLGMERVRPGYSAGGWGL